MSKRAAIHEKLVKRFGPQTTAAAYDKLNKQEKEPIVTAHETQTGRPVGFHRNIYNIKRERGEVEKIGRSVTAPRYAPGQYERIFGKGEVTDD